MLDLDVAGEFLVMAATLMRIKAKMLLPLPAVGEEEEEGDPREELVQRLVEYRQFKEAAGTLKTREEERRLLYERGMLPGEDEAGPLPLAPGHAVRPARCAQSRDARSRRADGLRGAGRGVRRRGEDVVARRARVAEQGSVSFPRSCWRAARARR